MSIDAIIKKSLINTILSGNYKRYVEICELHSVEISKTFTLSLNKLNENSIHIACIQNKPNFLTFIWKYISNNQSAFSFKDSCYKEPLHHACQHGSVDCVKWLLNNINNINVNTLKKADWTPIMLIVASKSVSYDIVKEIVDMLIDFKSNLEIVNKDGWTAFHLACRTLNIDVIKLLGITKPSCCVLPSNNGRTPLHTACFHGNLEVVKYLIIYHYPDVNVADNCGITPFVDCIIGGHVNVATWFLENSNAVVDTFDLMGRHPIHIACESGQMSSMKYLLGRFPSLIELRTRDKNRTPLLSAARMKHEGLIQYLISIGADSLATDNSGRTFIDFLL